MTKQPSKRTSRATPARKKVAPAVRQSPASRAISPAKKDSEPPARNGEFDEVLALIEAARREAGRAVNIQLIDLYWKIGEVICRRIRASAFERSVLGPPILSTALREIHPTAVDDFKDVYSIEFVDLPNGHSEADLHGALLRNLGRFITELGRDFCFVGSEYPAQVDEEPTPPRTRLGPGKRRKS